MKIDNTLKGWLEVTVYVVTCTYSWLNSNGINAYVVFVLTGFIALDMVLGVWKAAVVPELAKPSSKKAKRGILAKTVMLTIPVVCGLIWGAFDPDDGKRLANLMLTALMVAEGYSNIANAYSIYTREKIEEFDAVTYVFKQTARMIKRALYWIFEDKEENNN